MNYILDCSFITPLILAEDDSNKIENKFNKISEADVLYVPQLFWYEIANVMKKAIARKRITKLDAIHSLDLLSSYSLHTDTETGPAYSTLLLEIAGKYDLYCYDASYLELAIRKGGVMGTNDGNLARACKKAGIKTIL
ncbi:toxin of toxin-antitoxin [Treponema primitia ZAS-2]|uniref:Toxin of toxin-antitoxin n=1 Tax=Treponema primitia (strain ATCC BAA-887 / DSM 12427 / ZAS-2) TaxID=545694 RepID=F5YGW6_TREPZ|nr:type II toxin-antitoxin system VapC family toxin [Treponema primitia]AEF86197.1 toxin of toxin-antitoxin [Treponema primitia ZAS-2]